MVSRADEKRISIAYFSDSPYIGGAEKYLFLLASNIDRSLFKPVIIINRNPGLELLKEWMERERIPVYEVSLRLPFSLRGTGRFFRLLRRLKPTLLHMNLPGPFDSQFSLISPLARLAGVRHVVSTEHLPMVPSFTKARILKKFGTRWIDRVMTVSNDNRCHLVREHGVPEDKIRVVHIGIPEPGPQEPVDIRRNLNLGEDTFLLVIVGILDDRKGHRTLFDAMADLPGNFHLLVAGGGEQEGEYRKSVSEAGIGNRVHFLGIRNDVLAILKEVDLMVLPSEFDATPYVIVEAMASGLPVIASNIYGIPELVVDGETGLLIQPADSAALSDAVISLAEDRARRERMGMAARKRYETQFGIEASVSKVIEVYAELI